MMDMQTPPPPQEGSPQKSDYEWCGVFWIERKNNKKILRFLFFELSSKIGVIFFHKNDTKMIIIRKINIGKIWNLVFLPIQPIADLSSKL